MPEEQTSPPEAPQPTGPLTGEPVATDDSEQGAAPDLRTVSANLRDATGKLSSAPPVWANPEDVPEGIDPASLEGTPEWLMERIRRRGDREVPPREEALLMLNRGYTVGTWSGVPNYECVWCPDRPNNLGEPRPVSSNINKEWIMSHLTQVHLTGLPDAEEGFVYYRSLDGQVRSRRA